jgi:hypothetical protein
MLVGHTDHISHITHDLTRDMPQVTHAGDIKILDFGHAAVSRGRGFLASLSEIKGCP